MYIALRKEDIRKNYSDVKDRLEDTFRAKTVSADTIDLKPVVMESIDDTTGMVCKYGAFVLPRFRRWFMPYDDVTLTAKGVVHITPEKKMVTHDVIREFTPDVLIYGRFNELTHADDELLLRTFDIQQYVGDESKIGSHNLRNLLRVGQNGSFKEDGLFTILVNEERMREAFLKRQLSKTA